MAQGLNKQEVAKLARRLKSGDEDAWRQFVLGWRGRIAGFFAAMGFEGGAVDDMAQETFIGVCRSIHGLRREDRFTPWLYAIAQRIAAGCIEDGVEPTQPPASPAIAGFEHADTPSLRRALSALTPRERELLYLRHSVGLSPKQIASINDTSRLAVNADLPRIRRKLAAFIDGDGYRKKKT